MLCVGFHKMFPITTIIAITTKNFFFIQSHSFAKFRFIAQLLYSNYTIKLVNISTATLDCMRKVRTVSCPDFLAQS